MIEDERFIGWDIASVLEAHEISCHVVDTGEAALSAILDKKFGTFCVDILLPGISGWELIRAAKRIDPKIKIVIFSALQ